MLKSAVHNNCKLKRILSGLSLCSPNRNSHPSVYLIVITAYEAVQILNQRHDSMPVQPLFLLGKVCRAVIQSNGECPFKRVVIFTDSSVGNSFLNLSWP